MRDLISKVSIVASLVALMLGTALLVLRIWDAISNDTVARWAATLGVVFFWGILILTATRVVLRASLISKVLFWIFFLASLVVSAFLITVIWQDKSSVAVVARAVGTLFVFFIATMLASAIADKLSSPKDEPAVKKSSAMARGDLPVKQDESGKKPPG